MQAMLIITGIVLTLSVTLMLGRANRRLLVNTPVVSGKRVLTILNRSGFWLSLSGAVISAPMVFAAIFYTHAPGWGWTIWPGLAGGLAIAVGALLTVPVFFVLCAHRRLSPAGVGRGLYRQSFKPLLTRYGARLAWLLAALVLLAPLLPYVLALFKFILYAAGLLLAGRLGMLDGIDRNDDDEQHLTKFYNYAAGKWDDGLKHGGLYHHSDDW